MNEGDTPLFLFTLIPFLQFGRIDVHAQDVFDFIFQLFETLFVPHRKLDFMEGEFNLLLFGCGDTLVFAN